MPRVCSSSQARALSSSITSAESRGRTGSRPAQGGPRSPRATSCAASSAVTTTRTPPAGSGTRSRSRSAIARATARFARVDRRLEAPTRLGARLTCAPPWASILLDRHEPRPVAELEPDTGCATRSAAAPTGHRSARSSPTRTPPPAGRPPAAHPADRVTATIDVDLQITAVEDDAPGSWHPHSEVVRTWFDPVVPNAHQVRPERRAQEVGEITSAREVAVPQRYT